MIISFPGLLMQESEVSKGSVRSRFSATFGLGGTLEMGVQWDSTVPLTRIPWEPLKLTQTHPDQ